ncbi:competence/damage-inducible protein CinA [Melioribacter roseus P3M-2]|uniref:CinA-like protein n=1 Tax=Melioribacter roseus (strain DSM 23840 / JCM 17771 / VKM B-2668 / P3M-2) TaxID=1191523 RepID=I6ZUI0_MELRP|nr:competence/damage-inducible protein A [Melioribacter roseus]AFN75664.1 competence/damage-inducible protein CinA [Melioribacter roseus P3M-2]
MNAFLITIGDEILIGQVVNTNAAYIGEKLSELGVDVIGSSVLPDDENAIRNEFERAFNNSDLVLVTGGLGPTHDDVTRKVIVDFFDTELVMNQDVLNDIKKLFESRGRQLTKINEEQALVPKIAVPIRNSRGTAPGIWIEKENKIFIAMPGVPYEMHLMMESFVIPKLKDLMGDSKKIVLRKNLLTTGLPESHLYERLGDLKELLGEVKMAFLPNQFGVRLRITVEDDNEESAKSRIEAIEQKIRTKIGKYIYGKDDETLESVVAKLLTDRGLTLAVAESCTGGYVAHRLTNISGSSKFLERGVVAYSNAAKVELLKVDEDVISKYGAVSIEVARQMAEGVKSISGTDIGLSVTGIMGPTGATPDKPVGLVYIGICDDTICTAKEFRFGDDRHLNKDRASQAALDMIRRNLLGIPYDD